LGAPELRSARRSVAKHRASQEEDLGLGDNICMRKSGTATAFMVRGDIHKVYFQNRGRQGWLGYPIEDEHGEQRFEHGRIVWDAAKASFRSQA
jgi:hypothetical protein